MELGKRQVLTIVKEKEIGVYLGEEGSERTVLLPKKEVPAGAKPGDALDVFLYKDSEDRLIATTAQTEFEVGGLAVLTVSQVTEIGAFLRWALVKDLFLPFKEQRGKLKEGQQVLVALYVDKSGRLCATMKIYGYLSSDSPYQRNDKVTGTVYQVKDEVGALVAVDNRYYGLIPEQELYSSLRPGDSVEARVLQVRPDGKLDLSNREKAYVQMDQDAERVWQAVLEYDGKLPLHDKSDPEEIKKELQMSKNAFKRAAGRLLKTGRIRITEDGIEKISG
ncbi:S1-like domain-containing RNA-binding protein [Cuneatibacter sp. NSJ-177]|uniref:CvfB family protein n=1 Tax=Cuneatibacter sp. NSJ-177 TaxID=2931401 RepID=UPI001FD2BA77|nr:S1-like domain-containing RNA-binding protein [Cuneatibacter sp. NSJ-177]MCJ7837270.1 S1-like domain-containing RNA-binding protein [Cuneatibacter sp. NSJ-177]